MENVNQIDFMHKKILDTILALKDEAEIPDAQFERRLNLSSRTINEWRRGKSKGYLKIIPDIAALLDVEESALLNYELGGEELNERIFTKLADISDGQLKLSRFLEVSPKTVSAWKSRGSTPPSKYLSKIAKFLGVSLEWIMDGEETAPANIAKGGDDSVFFMQSHKYGTLYLGKGEQRTLSPEALELVRRFEEEYDYKQRRRMINLMEEMEKEIRV